MSGGEVRAPLVQTSRQCSLLSLVCSPVQCCIAPHEQSSDSVLSRSASGCQWDMSCSSTRPSFSLTVRIIMSCLLVLLDLSSSSMIRPTQGTV